MANQRGGSDWEPIKILLEGDGDSNKTNMASNTRLRLTTQVGQAHVATGVPLDLGTNEQPSEPKHTNTHSGNLHGLLPVLHRSDRWPAPVRLVTPVRPVDIAGKAGGCSNRTTSVPESLSDFSRSWNKNTPKTQPARKGSHEFPPPNPQEQGPENTSRKPPREGSENHHQEQLGTTHQSLEEPR
jgi:hypothetical protein